ncbi:MAG TPA: DUF6297 family protein [Nakamurella sp.]|nr:DUF6297 family protein [Nakamurella sp.]
MRLLTQVRRVGRGRKEPTDWWTLLLAVFVLAGFPVQVTIGLAAGRASGGPAAIPAALTVGVSVLLGAMVLAVAMALGPVRGSPAEYTWVLGGPVDRRSELTPRWVRTLAGTGVLGAAVAAVAAAVGGADPVELGLTVAIGGGLGVALAAAATGLQGTTAQVRRAVQAGTTGVGMVFVGLAVVLIRLGRTPSIPGLVALVGAPFAVLLAVLTVVWGWRTIAALDRVALTAGNALFTAGGAAVLFMDPALLGDVLAQRRFSHLRIQRSRSFPAGRRRGLLTAEWVRAVRNRRAAGVFVSALLVPYASATVVPARWLPAVALLSAVPAVSPFGSGMRKVCQSAALRRMLGGTDSALKMLHLATPAAAAVLFTLFAAPAMPADRWIALALTPIGVLTNLWLRATAKPMEFDGLVADLGFGPAPVQLSWFLIRGVAPLAIVASLQLSI